MLPERIAGKSPGRIHGSLARSDPLPGSTETSQEGSGCSGGRSRRLLDLRLLRPLETDLELHGFALSDNSEEHLLAYIQTRERPVENLERLFELDSCFLEGIPLQLRQIGKITLLQSARRAQPQAAG